MDQDNNSAYVKHESQANLVPTAPSSDFENAKVDTVDNNHPPINQDAEDANYTYEESELISIPDLGKVRWESNFNVVVLT